VRADSKKHARLAIIRHVLHQLACPKLEKQIPEASSELLYKFTAKAIKDGRLAD
jgi:hypothetical protein